MSYLLSYSLHANNKVLQTSTKDARDVRTIATKVTNKLSNYILKQSASFNSLDRDSKTDIASYCSEDSKLHFPLKLSNTKAKVFCLYQAQKIRLFCGFKSFKKFSEY